MNPNFVLMTPRMNVIMAEDCNVPALRNIRHYGKPAAARPAKKTAQEGSRFFLKALVRK